MLKVEESHLKGAFSHAECALLVVFLHRQEVSGFPVIDPDSCSGVCAPVAWMSYLVPAEHVAIVVVYLAHCQA